MFVSAKVGGASGTIGVAGMMGVCSIYGAADLAGILTGFIKYAMMMTSKPRMMYKTVFQGDGKPKNKATAMMIAPNIIIIWRLDMTLSLYSKGVQ